MTQKLHNSIPKDPYTKQQGIWIYLIFVHFGTPLHYLVLKKHKKKCVNWRQNAKSTPLVAAVVTDITYGKQKLLLISSESFGPDLPKVFHL